MHAHVERATPPSSGARGVWDRSRRALTIGLVAVVAFTAFEALAVATVLPVTVREIGGLHLYGWTFSAFMLANLVGIVAAGGASDRSGLTPPFIAGTALFVAGLVVAGVAPSMPVVVAGRFVQGFGAGAIGAVSYAAIAAGYDDAAKPRMLALLSSAWVVPGLVGPALAGLIADHVGWRWVFLGLAPPTLAAAAVAIPALRRLSRASEAATRDDRLRSAVLLAAGAGCTLLALDGVAQLASPLLFVAGVAIGVPALRRLLPEGTLRAAPGQPAAVAVMGLIGLAFFGAEAFVPLALTDVRGQPASLAGLPLTLGTLTWTAGAWVQAREAPRRSRSGLVAAGVALVALGIAAAVSVLLPDVPFMVATLAWGVAALGMGMAYSTSALVILETAPPDRQGESSAALQLSITLGTALGTGAGGAVLALLTAAAWPLASAIAAVFATTVAALAVALVVAFRLPGRPRARAPYA
ncbi:MAG TPA: MFS transporter [Candidatus Binatia bacterium]